MMCGIWGLCSKQKWFITIKHFFFHHTKIKLLNSNTEYMADDQVASVSFQVY